MNLKTAKRDEITQFMEQTFDLASIRDYCPNGLQVEGKSDVHLIISGVTANQALIDTAIRQKADAILVHHGLFWRDDDPRIVGLLRKRLRPLLMHDINLYAVHLPLDRHPEIGNNALLGQQLGLSVTGHFGEQDIGFFGHPNDPALQTVGDLYKRVETQLGRTPLLIGDPTQKLEGIAWCSGGAQSLFRQALGKEINVYLTGEISEKNVHEAREHHIAWLACGHHATERAGIQALGQRIADHFGIRHEFVEIDSPV